MRQASPMPTEPHPPSMSQSPAIQKQTQNSSIKTYSGQKIDSRKLICGIEDEHKLSPLYLHANIRYAGPISITVESGKITSYQGKMPKLLEPILTIFDVPLPNGSHDVIFASIHYKRLCGGKYHAALFSR